MTDEVTAAPLVRFELLGQHIALVTLDRPEKRNAISPEVASQLEAIVRRIEDDPEIRVAILTSSEPRVFCAALILVLCFGQGGWHGNTRWRFCRLRLCPADQPWIAAVEGMALAGGCEICLSST